MKLLLTFVVACLVMFAVLAWLLFSPGTATAPPAQPAPVPAPSAVTLPAPQPESIVVSEDSPPPSPPPALEPRPVARVPQSLPTTAQPDTQPTTQPVVHWPADPDTKAAQTRLQLARRALCDDPDSLTARKDELSALAALSRWTEALDSLAHLQEQAPDDVNLQFEQAAILLRLRRTVEALGILNEIVRVQPDHARAWFNLAAAHQTLGHLPDARHAWDQAIALDPTTEAYAQRGTVLLAMEEWGAAAADWEEVLRAVPDATDATLNLTLAWWRGGRVDAARTELIALLGKHPRHVPALNRLAQMSWQAYLSATTERTELRDETIAWCRQSLEIDPGQDAIQQLLARAEGAP